MRIDDALHNISTMVIAETSEGQFQGTGFYYNRLGPTDKEGPQWRRVDGMWLVTNRHVLIPRHAGTEVAPTRFTFHLRRLDKADSLVWDPITLSTEDFAKLARFHPDKSIDVAAVAMLELLTDRIKDGSKYTAPYGLSADDLPNEKSIDMEVASDVIVVGYPRAFYDKVNLFPIVKSGIIASRWGRGFDGQPCFLIDAKLFPGSSGSVVLSKPNDLMVKDGKMMYAKEKQFSFLGVFSGEPGIQEEPVEVGDPTIRRKSDFNLGIVWHAELIEDVLNDGVTLEEALAT